MSTLDRTAAVQAARDLVAAHPVVIDTETTGFGVSDQIVEISVVDWDGKTLFHQRVKPTIPIPPDTARYHGITDADVAGCLSFAQIWPELKTILAGRALASYNLEYDTRMIYQSLRAHGTEDRLAIDKSGCIMTLYAAFYGDWSEYHGNYRYKKLSFAAEHFGLPSWIEHGSLADAQAARLVLLKLSESKI